jgi:hypothetical protein
MLLTPANLEHLTGIEVESVRSAAAKLALPAPIVDVTSVASVDLGRRGDDAGTTFEADTSGDGARTEALGCPWAVAIIWAPV